VCRLPAFPGSRIAAVQELAVERRHGGGHCGRLRGDGRARLALGGARDAAAGVTTIKCLVTMISNHGRISVLVHERRFYGRHKSMDAGNLGMHDIEQSNDDVCAINFGSQTSLCHAFVTSYAPQDTGPTTHLSKYVRTDRLQLGSIRGPHRRQPQPGQQAGAQRGTAGAAGHQRAHNLRAPRDVLSSRLLIKAMRMCKASNEVCVNHECVRPCPKPPV
jgi:hypothetical protein